MIQNKTLVFFFISFLFITSCQISQKSSMIDSVQSSDVWWIDTHVHPSTNIVSLDEAKSGEAKSYCFSEECLTPELKKMDALHIQQALLMPMPSLVHSKTFENGILQAVQLHPDRFAYVGGGSSLNPLLQKAVLEGNVTDTLRDEFTQTAQDLLTKGVVGFGEIAILHLSMSQNHPYEEAYADHELLLILADIAAKNNVPIDIHMDLVVEDMKTPAFYSSHGKNPGTLTKNLAAFERLLAHNPDAKIVWAHVGSDTTGVLTPDIVRDLLKKYPNFYAQLRLSGSPSKGHELLSKGSSGTLSEDWRSLIEDYPNRFTVGSDAFFGNEEESKSQTAGSLFLSQLSEETARKVGCENAVALYNLMFSCEKS